MRLDRLHLAKLLQPMAGNTGRPRSTDRGPIEGRKQASSPTPSGRRKNNEFPRSIDRAPLKPSTAGRVGKKLSPIHPGEHLADILKEAGISANALALHLRVPANRITAIIQGKRSITADTALRLARYFGTSAEFWIGLQSKYDIDLAEDTLARRIEREVIPRSAA